MNKALRGLKRRNVIRLCLGYGRSGVSLTSGVEANVYRGVYLGRRSIVTAIVCTLNKEVHRRIRIRIDARLR